MLFSVTPHSECHNVIDFTAVKSEDHVRIDLVNLVHVVSHNIVEAPVRVDLALHGNAILNLIETLMQVSNLAQVSLSWTRLVSLLEACRVVLIKVEAFDRVLEKLDYLFSSVFFVIVIIWIRLKGRIINAAIDIWNVVVVAGRDPNDIRQTLFLAELRAEEHIEGTVVEHNYELVRVFAFLHGFKPAHMVNFACFLDLLLVVVLDDDAFL